jgi:hypothetical protein
MHRRVANTANGTTTTTPHLTLEDANDHDHTGDDSNAKEESVAVVSKFPRRRRRKVRSTAFKGHYGSSFFPKDSGVRCLIGLVAILAALICAGLVVIFRLMEQKHVSLFKNNNNNKNNNNKLASSGGANADTRPRPSHPFDTEGDFPDLPASQVYAIPNSMSHIGDKSDEYAAQRMAFGELHPYDTERSLQGMNQVRKHQFQAFENPSYDIYNCPDQPPKGYPHDWNTLTLLEHWKPDDPNPPSKLHQGLCVFDYRTDYVKALTYRKQELPFVMSGDPAVAQAVERWNSPGYMDELMGDVMHRAEYSETNHFMYWQPGKPRKRKGGRGPPQKAPEGWKEPTKLMRMTYADWLKHANVTDDAKLGPDQPHWYFRLIGCGETDPEGHCDSGSSEYLFDELTFFQPRPGLMYMVEPHEQKGIHCRFGMRGVTAENHFDASRNSIAVLGGERRYILSHPSQCQNLALFPKGHPSARHSAVDWSDPDLDEYPEFASAQSSEVVLQAGDVLYLPTNWFHYIISLSLNFQCNTRSGRGDETMDHMHECGF